MKIVLSEAIANLFTSIPEYNQVQSIPAKKLAVWEIAPTDFACQRLEPKRWIQWYLLKDCETL